MPYLPSLLPSLASFTLLLPYSHTPEDAPTFLTACRHPLSFPSFLPGHVRA